MLLSLLCLLFCYFGQFVHSSLRAEDFILQHEEDQIKIPFTKVNGLLINDICVSFGKNCRALKVANSKQKITKLPKMNLSSPAQDLCVTVGGTALTLFKADHSSVGFCTFDDQSIISSWDLYNIRIQQKTKPTIKK